VVCPQLRDGDVTGFWTTESAVELWTDVSRESAVGGRVWIASVAGMELLCPVFQIIALAMARLIRTVDWGRVVPHLASKVLLTYAACSTPNSCSFGSWNCLSVDLSLTSCQY